MLALADCFLPPSPSVQWEISDARLALLQSVYDAHAERILQLYTALQSRNAAGPHLAQLHERALKHHLFTLLAAGNAHRSVLASRHQTKSAVKADVAKLARELLSRSVTGHSVGLG